jgi:hypothetical protein
MKDNSFWVVNISKMNVSLRDLNLTIKARASVNLMDSKHYNYTLEQLKKSVESGSIFNKRDKIKVRKVPPYIETSKIYLSKSPVYNYDKLYSNFSFEEKHFEELLVSDEQIASDLADLISGEDQ